MDNLNHPFLLKYSGLSTENALRNILLEILEFRREINIRNKRTFCSTLIKNSFHHRSYYNSLSWIPLLILTLLACLLVITNSSMLVVVIIVVFLILNIGVTCWDNYLILSEFQNRIDFIILSLRNLQEKNDWHLEQFPDLYTPVSPSVSLQWTIRNGQLLNLPCSLLTRDDLIIMKSGQLSPADAETVLPPPSQDNKYNILIIDQLFVCDSDEKLSAADFPISLKKQLVEDKLYRVIKAPYVARLNVIAEKFLSRPSLYDKAKFLLFGKCIHHVILPICFVICEIIAIIRWFFLPIKHLLISYLDEFLNFFVIETGSIFLSMISLVFPLFWFFSNKIANVLLIMRYSSMENSIVETSTNSQSILLGLEFTSTIANRKNILEKFYWWNNFFCYVFHFCTGYHIVGRYTNFLHKMASVTALCCVDKEGVLSWPNPIAEKVFFLKKNPEFYNPNKKQKNNQDNNILRYNDEDFDDNGTCLQEHKIMENYENEKSHKLTATVEVLDLTPRINWESICKVEFDDSRWRCYLPSLKPLGLAILLNTCNKNISKTYDQFCTYLASISAWNQNFIPLVNRKCLCGLARQIGFSEYLVKNKFSLESQIFIHKNATNERIQYKYFQAFGKSRSPFPHATSVIVSENKCCSNYEKSYHNNQAKVKFSCKCYHDKQLFNQGAADVILDFCSDYWDGFDVCPLTPLIRKKILDFYQRSNLTAYCTAFSYRPVYEPVQTSPNLNSNAIHSKSSFEINIESSKNVKLKRRRPLHLKFDLTEYEKLSPRFKPKKSNIDEVIGNVQTNEETYLHENVDNEDCSSEDNKVFDKKNNYCAHYFSNDCYKGNVLKRKAVQNEINDETSVFFYDYSKFLSKQIFLGMMSMQYQPLLDTVQIVEELEKACIRFVHFSKENELRSRIFSEKMGLETGWNCHISLAPNIDENQCNENEHISTTAEHEISSNMEIGVSSADDEENMPFTFQLPNRAKLPCGIKNIKPHLEQVDNVPLLVSLFTDCTSGATEEMLSIMQEYGQVVCVLGSSANVNNFSIFAQADASISVAPLYSQVCQQIPLARKIRTKKIKNCLSPIELSELLNSLPCSLILERNNDIHQFLPLHRLIAESRNIMRLLWNSSQFWLCCITSTSSIQLLVHIFMLPSIFTLEQTLWLSIVIIPFLSISLICDSNDPTIMSKAKGKDWLCFVNQTTISYAFRCYGTKLFSCILFVFISYITRLKDVCNCLTNEIFQNSTLNANSPIIHLLEKNCPFIFVNNNSSTKLELKYLNAIRIVQHQMVLILIVHFVALCASFLHRDTVFWKKVPHFRPLWICSMLTLIFCQLIFCVYITNFSSDEYFNLQYPNLKNIIFIIILPFFTYLISEIIKIFEIRANERYQKKVRLEFGTKLGMNSPF